MSEFWNWWVIIIVAINILGCWGLLHWTRKMKISESDSEMDQTTGHVYDGIEEYNNPLPRWWLNLFYITLVFSVVYLILYPGMGNFSGILNWSQEKQHQEEVVAAKKTYQPLFEKYAKIPIEELVHNKQAIEMGRRIFVNTCFGCHGSDARGNPGYPNLTDQDWLWGGSPEQIEQSIAKGRKGNMPAFGKTLTAEQSYGLVQYIGHLSGYQVDESKMQTGKKVFDTQCFVCHGKNAKGNIAMGAPNLTDDIWLHSGSRVGILKTITDGRIGEMPPHEELLGAERVHLVAAYVYSLSNKLTK